MEEYTSNSNKSKEIMNNPEPQLPKKNITPVVKSGGVKVKKKNEVQKFADVFVTEDVHNVKNYILIDVLIPAIKKTISEIVTNSIDMLLYGESGRPKKKNSASRVSYQSYYDNDRPRSPKEHRTRQSTFDLDTFIFDNRMDAQAVLAGMDDILDVYQFVSVGDFYDLADQPTDNYMVNKWGWTDLSSANIVHVAGGFILKLPKPMPLD